MAAEDKKTFTLEDFEIESLGETFSAEEMKSIMGGTMIASSANNCSTDNDAA